MKIVLSVPVRVRVSNLIFFGNGGEGGVRFSLFWVRGKTRTPHFVRGDTHPGLFFKGETRTPPLFCK